MFCKKSVFIFIYSYKVNTSAQYLYLIIKASFAEFSLIIYSQNCRTIHIQAYPSIILLNHLYIHPVFYRPRESFYFHFFQKCIFHHIRTLNKKTKLKLAQIIKDRPQAYIFWLKLTKNPISTWVRNLVSFRALRS